MIDFEGGEPDDESDAEVVRRLARELGFADDDETVRHALAEAERLERALEADAPSLAEGTPTGHRSADEHNALCYVYDEPRTETEDGPLSGMTFAIKDNLAVKNLQMTCGLADHVYVPAYDAVVVERLLDAGATIVGKANMYALGIGRMSELGRVRNAIDATRVPGGSSSGSAVAVATGLVDASIGSDAGGSVRIPAAFSELVGVKPTPGTVPDYGSVATMKTLGTKGPIARTVEAAARVLDAIAGPDGRDPNTVGRDVDPVAADLDAGDSFVIGLPGAFFDEADGRVADAIRGLAAGLEARTDCECRELQLDRGPIHLPPYFSGPELARLVRGGGVSYGGGSPLDPVTRHFLGAVSADGFNELISRKKLPHVYLDRKSQGLAYAAAQRALADYRETVAAAFEEVDLLLTPTVPMLPPEVEANVEDEPSTSGNTRPFNLAGTPAVTVPAGRVDGLPVGAQVVAPPFADGRALQGARLVERVRE